MLSGVIDWFDSEKGWGFIADDGEMVRPRTYFRRSVVQGGVENIRVGARVAYELDPTSRNGPLAALVMVEEVGNVAK